MAKATLAFRDLDDDLLPDVCAKCGAPATARKNKLFSWQPSWIGILILFGLLPYIIVSLILTKRRTVSVPFCEAHKNHWSWRLAALLGSFAGVALVGGVAMVLFATSDRGGNGNELGGWLCVATLFLLVVWLVAAVIIQNTAIQPSEITDYSITLRNVSGDFTAAYEQEMGDDFPRGVDRAVRDEWRQPESRKQREPDDKIRRPGPPRPPTDA